MNFSKQKQQKYVYDFDKLVQHGFKITNQRKLENFVFKYGLTRVVNGYAACLLDKNKKFLDNIDTKQLIKVANFDRKLGLLLINRILDFETRLNSIMVTTILRENKLDNNYVLEAHNCTWLTFDTLDEKKEFIKQSYQNADGSNLLKEDLKLYAKKIPLISLSLSWSFYDIINVYQHINLSTQQKILHEFNLDNWDVTSFIWMCHIIRKLRNKITHNDFVFVSYFKSNQNLNRLLNINTNNIFLKIKNVCEFLDKIKTQRTRIKNKIYWLIKKFRFKFIVKRKVLIYLGYL